MVPDCFQVNQEIKSFLTMVPAAVEDIKVQKVPVLRAN